MDPAVDEILATLQKESFFWRAKQATKEEILKPANRQEAEDSRIWQGRGNAKVSQDAVAKAFAASGWRDQVKAFAYHRLRAMRFRAGDMEEPTPTDSAIAFARRTWADVLTSRLNGLAKDQRQAFLRRRQSINASPRSTNRACSASPRSASVGGRRDDEEVSTRHIVDLAALYKLITRDLRTFSHASRLPKRAEGTALGVQLSVPTLDALRLRFAELAPGHAHLGVPDPADSAATARLEPSLRGFNLEEAGPRLEARRRRLATQLLGTAYPAELQIFARFGVPPSMRREVWSSIMGVTESTGTAALQEAAKGINEWEWLTDDVLRLDVSEHCANDVSYFPFDEIAEALVLALSRDPQISSMCESGPPQVPIVIPAPDSADATVSNEVSEGTLTVPPSGVVPFKGFSNYACPFAFLADRLETAYPLFRAFYCRVLCHLHTISNRPETLLHLCALFESLAEATAPRAAQHVKQLAVDSAPLRFAFHWIVTGFAGCLPAEQLLHLWDRLLGFDSPVLVPILAAAIFAFRARLVLGARRLEEVQLLFADISCIKVVPLLQAFLFGDELGSGAVLAAR